MLKQSPQNLYCCPLRLLCRFYIRREALVLHGLAALVSLNLQSFAITLFQSVLEYPSVFLRRVGSNGRSWPSASKNTQQITNGYTDSVILPDSRVVPAQSSLRSFFNDEDEDERQTASLSLQMLPDAQQSVANRRLRSVA